MSKKRTGRLEVNLAYKTATVTPSDGGEAYLYGPGVTRRNAEERIEADGWRVAEGSAWELSDPPDGFIRDVEQG